MNRRNKRGVILYTAVVIAFLTMLWAIAAVHRVQYQTGATLHSYQKSEAYYLAKQAASRSLALLNGTTNWLQNHNDKDSPDSLTTPGAEAWVEQDGSRLTLFVVAKVAGQKRELKVPILDDSSDSSKVFSLSPSSNGGPDVVSWATTEDGDWKGLPPIPGATGISSMATAKNGDVFACTGDSTGSLLWRYRTGQGWMRMPDLPSNSGLSQLTIIGDSKLVGKSSNNRILKLPLGESPGTPMLWESIPAPGSNTIQAIEADPRGADKTFVTTTEGTNPRVWILNGSSWNSQVPPSGVSNLDGGITVDMDGKLYVASNGQPARMFVRDSGAAGTSANEWRPIDTGVGGVPGSVPAIEWLGASAQAPSGFIENIVRIEADPGDNSVWVQWDDQGGANAHNVVKIPAQ